MDLVELMTSHLYVSSFPLAFWKQKVPALSFGYVHHTEEIQMKIMIMGLHSW
jgi:hypothetical protein